MNLIYLCCITDPWVEVAEHLSEEHGLHPSYFVSWKDDGEILKKNEFVNCHFQTLEDAWKGKGFPDYLKPKVLDENIIKSLAWYELVALKMMDRLDPAGYAFPFTSRQYFFHDLVGYWMAVVEDRDINLVISPSVPHRVFDYALYVVCRIMRVRFITFQMTPFGSNSLLLDDLDKPTPIYSENNRLNKLPSRLIMDSISKVSGEYDTAIPDYMVKHKKKEEENSLWRLSFLVRIGSIMLEVNKLFGSFPNTYWVEKGKMPSESNMNWLEFYKAKYKRIVRVKSFEREYSRLVRKEFSKPYVLVALHYQPEETSCPTGGSYVDQILMTQIMDEILPEGVSIVVKEHKSQFYTHQEGSAGREGLFYRRLSRLSKRIFFASVDHNPFDLIDDAEATITISGTIGWESAIRGTPVIIFGRAWYENMPRVLKVKTRDDVMQAWDKLRDLKNKDMDPQILDFHASLEQRFVLSTHYRANVGKGDVSIKESTHNLVKGIVSHLDKVGNGTL